MFYKKDVLKNFAKFTRKHLRQSLVQVFYCEFCEIFKSNYFEEHLSTTASVQNMFLKISQNLQKNTFVEVSFLLKFQGGGLQRYIKKATSTQVFSYKIFGNAIFTGHLQVTDSNQWTLLFQTDLLNTYTQHSYEVFFFRIR